MGNYNDYYQRYYSSIPRQTSRQNMNKKISTSNMNSYKLSRRKGNFILNRFQNFGSRFIIQLTVVLFLMIVLLSCKTFNNVYTRDIYDFSKEVIEKSYNINTMLDKVKQFNFEEVETKSIMFIEKIRSTITGGETLQDEVKTDYALPVSMNNSNGEDSTSLLIQGVNKENMLWIKLDNESDINSCQKGKIKKIDSDGSFGTYIVIDHGKGIETKYNNLTEVTVKVGDEVEKGQVIGKIKPDFPNFKTFYFELLYMGERQKVTDYLVI
ncbi:M23 family metallopeptidase [Clostridium sp.]|uniref:M23 family metallopeptidase n=1 Tax=Clostridium sp. TaxID=1506 RepID=UPI002FCB9423